MTNLPRAGELLWKSNVPGAVNSILVNGDLVIVSYGHRNGNGGVNAFYRSTGELIWTFSTPQPILTGIIQFQDSMFFATVGFLGARAELYCLHNKGGLIWKQNLPAGAWSKLVLDQTNIYIGLDDGQVLIFNKHNGQQVSHIQAGLPRGKVWLFQLDERTLIAISKKGTILALSLPGLQPIWPNPINLKSEITSAPCLAKGKLYIGLQGGKVFELNLRTRKERIIILDEDMEGVMTAPFFVNDMLLVAARNHSLYALDISTGSVHWKYQDFEHNISVSPHAGEGFVAVCVNSFGLVLFNLSTGQLLWSHRVEKEVTLLSEPVIDDGVILVGTDHGELLALPWHLGNYELAASNLKKISKFHEAGLYYEMAAQQAKSIIVRESLYQKAEDCWIENGEPEWAAKMWEGMALNLKAAEAYYRAADLQRGKDNRLSAEYYYQSPMLFWRFDSKSIES